MQRHIDLYWDNCKLGSLTYVSGQYIFIKDEHGYEEAEQNDGCPNDILLFGIEKISAELHPIFAEFEVNHSRKDLIGKLKIERTDDRFTKLYKRALAYDEFVNDGFWIKAEEEDPILRISQQPYEEEKSQADLHPAGKTAL